MLTPQFCWLSTAHYRLRGFYLVKVLNGVYSIHPSFISCTLLNTVLIEVFWFSTGPEFLPFLLVHKFHKLTSRDESQYVTHSTQNTSPNHLTCYVCTLNFQCWSYCFANTIISTAQQHRWFLCLTLVTNPNSRNFSKLLTNLNEKGEREAHYPDQSKVKWISQTNVVETSTQYRIINTHSSTETLEIRLKRMWASNLLPLLLPSGTQLLGRNVHWKLQLKYSWRSITVCVHAGRLSAFAI